MDEKIKYKIKKYCTKLDEDQMAELLELVSDVLEDKDLWAQIGVDNGWM